MTKVMNAVTDAAGTSASWVPTADTVIQIATDADNTVTMQVETRLDALADWVVVISFNPRFEPLVSVVKLPEIRLSWAGSTSAISGWSV